MIKLLLELSIAKNMTLYDKINPTSPATKYIKNDILTIYFELIKIKN